MAILNEQTVNKVENWHLKNICGKEEARALELGGNAAVVIDGRGPGRCSQDRGHRRERVCRTDLHQHTNASAPSRQCSNSSVTNWSKGTAN